MRALSTLEVLDYGLECIVLALGLWLIPLSVISLSACVQVGRASSQLRALSFQDLISHSDKLCVCVGVRGGGG